MATIDMKVYGAIDELKQARASLGTPAALNEAIVATGIDALFVLLEGGTVVFEETPMRLVPADVTLYRINRPEECICPELKDIMPIRVADMGCPVHGVDVQTASSGDGYWRLVEVSGG